MPDFKIANIVGSESDRRGSNPAIYRIPRAVIGSRFEVGEVELGRSVAMLNDLDRALMELTFVEAGQRAAQQGYDAIFICPVADYGVRQLRACVNIPVVGAGQASMQIAAGLGARFAIITVWPPTIRRSYERHLRETGFESLCSGVYYVTEEQELGAFLGPDGLMKKLGTTHRGALFDRTVQVARKAIQDGADVIVLGCTCMSPICSDLAADLDGIPVVDPLVSGYKFAEMLLTLGLHYREAPRSLHASQLGAMIRAASRPEPAAKQCDDVCSTLSNSAVLVANTAN
jgi:allantoin racemase